MRKTTQSMYQPQNKSALGQSKLIGGLEVSGIGGNKSQFGNTGSLRKIEGQDFSKTTKPSFEQSINKLKSKPNQKVLEDQYIKGLQQQIKYLQYELKLLKDKQILEREGVNELDNFLKDEIPINENILAMKNKYNATKNTLEQKFKLLTTKNVQFNDVLKMQKGQIQRLHDIINGHRHQVQGRNTDFKKKLSQVVRQLTLTSTQYSALGQNNREYQQKIKKMSEQIANIQRNIEKQKVLQVRALQQKSKAAQKFDQTSRKTKEDMLQAVQRVKQMQQYARQKGTNPLSDDLQSKNSTLRKRIMLNEKQRSTAQNIIAEINLLLKQEQRERQIQRKQKLKHTNSSEQCRLQIQNYERFSDNMIKDQMLRTKQIMLKQMDNDLRQKQSLYDLLTDRLRDLQQDASNLINEKKELQGEIQDEEQKQKAVGKKIKELQAQILQNRCQSQSLTRVNRQQAEQVGRARGQLQLASKKVPVAQQQIQRKNGAIHYLNKQVQLLKELKGLDLDHLQMISTSGYQMQNTLNQFIKNWEKLKSL